MQYHHRRRNRTVRHPILVARHVLRAYEPAVRHRARPHRLDVPHQCEVARRLRRFRVHLHPHR